MSGVEPSLTSQEGIAQPLTPEISVYMIEEDDHVYLSIGGFHIAKFKSGTNRAAVLLQLEARLREGRPC